MAERRERAEHAGIADQDVELAVALVERGAEPVDAVVVLQVERHERRRAAGGAGSRRRAPRAPPTVRASATTCAPALGERERGGAADAARGAGDQRDAVGEGFGHVYSSFRAHARRSTIRSVTVMTSDGGSGLGAHGTGTTRAQLASASSDSCAAVAREVGQRGRIVAGEAVVGELRPHRVAPLVAHGAVDAVDREEGERVGADVARASPRGRASRRAACRARACRCRNSRDG